jgi:anti-sigma B factor antagonist
VTDLRITQGLSEGWLQIVTLEGELDAYTAPKLQEAVTSALDEGVAWLIIDLAAVDYIDSVGLGILIGSVKRAGEREGNIAVVCSRRNVRRVFEVSGTAEMLNVVEGLPRAVDVLKAERAAKRGECGEGQGGDSQ